MKATLEFNLPEEKEEHENAINGSKWRYAVLELDNELRKINKYGECKNKAKFANEVRDKLAEILDADGLRIFN